MAVKINIKVQKRDGKLEDYDPEKIKKVVKAAGLDEVKTEKLVKDINKWVSTLKKEKITSLQIRDRILVVIQKLDDYASKKYIWWERYKDRNFPS